MTRRSIQLIKMRSTPAIALESEFSTFNSLGRGRRNGHRCEEEAGFRLQFRSRAAGGRVMLCEVPNRMEDKNEERTRNTV
jgi:hypothetical protein